MTNASHSPTRRLRVLGAATIVSLALAGFAQAQTKPAAAPVVQSSAPQALTVTEQAAAAQLLGQVNALSGALLQAEVRRLAKQFSDQNLNLTAIAGAVKAASGNKLGAVTSALSSACKEAPPGSVESVAVCAAAAAQPDSTGRITCPPSMEAVADPSSNPTIYTCQPLGQSNALVLGVGRDTAGLDTVGGAAGGSGATGTGSGTGNGTGNNTLSSGSQSYSSFGFSGRSSTSSVGKSVSQR